MIDASSVYVIEVMFVGTVILVALLAALITVGLERQRGSLGGIGGDTVMDQFGDGVDLVRREADHRRGARRECAAGRTK